MLELILTRIRMECTEKDQNQGLLSVVIRDAEKKIQTYKTNESIKTLVTKLKNAIETQNIDMLELTLKEAQKVESFDSSNLAVVIREAETTRLILSLQNAIQTQNIKILELTLNQVRTTLSEKEQNQGPLAITIQNAENMMQTHKSNEKHRIALETLRTSLETHDMSTLRMALRDVKEEEGDEDNPVVTKARVELDIFDSKRRASYLASELQHAVSRQDLGTTQLVLKRVRGECTKKQQSEGSLAVAIRDAEIQIRMYNIDKAVRHLKSCVEKRDLPALKHALSNLPSNLSEEENFDEISRVVAEAQSLVFRLERDLFRAKLIQDMEIAIADKDISTLEYLLKSVHIEDDDQDTIRRARRLVQSRNVSQIRESFKSAILDRDCDKIRDLCFEAKRVGIHDEESIVASARQVLSEEIQLMSLLDSLSNCVERKNRDRVQKLLLNIKQLVPTMNTIQRMKRTINDAQLLLRSLSLEMSESKMRKSQEKLKVEREKLVGGLRTFIAKRDLDGIERVLMALKEQPTIIMEQGNNSKPIKRRNTVVEAEKYLSILQGVESHRTLLDDLESELNTEGVEDLSRIEELYAKALEHGISDENYHHVLARAKSLLKKRKSFQDELARLQEAMASHDLSGMQSALRRVEMKWSGSSWNDEKSLDTVEKAREMILNMMKMDIESPSVSSTRKVLLKAKDTSLVGEDHHHHNLVEEEMHSKVKDEKDQREETPLPFDQDLLLELSEAQNIVDEAKDLLSSFQNEMQTSSTAVVAKNKKIPLSRIDPSLPVDKSSPLDMFNENSSLNMKDNSSPPSPLNMSFPHHTSPMLTARAVKKYISSSQLFTDSESFPVDSSVVVVDHPKNVDKLKGDDDESIDTSKGEKLDTLTGYPMCSAVAPQSKMISSRKTEKFVSSMPTTPPSLMSQKHEKNTTVVIHVTNDSKATQKLISKETEEERIDRVNRGTLTITREMEFLWLHFAYYSHTYVPRDLDHVSGVAAMSFVQDLCQVMQRQRGEGQQQQKRHGTRCKEMDRATIKILLYAICRRGKNVSMMFGEFIRLIYCFSTTCRNGLACCGT